MTPPRTSRAAPIRTVTRKAWHAPGDRWQFTSGYRQYSCPGKPTCNRDGSWCSWDKLSCAPKFLRNRISWIRAATSLRCIITKPRRAGAGDDHV